MKYEDHLICFIDVLGFKSAINQSLIEPEIIKHLYKVIYSLEPTKLSNFVYDTMPTSQLNVDGTVSHTTLGRVDTSIKQNFLTHMPLNITQFSDSFVISCPSNNDVSCNLLLKAVYLIKMMFFHNLGMLMRGAITKGLLIHESQGALFGPSMIEAYDLESKFAVYPRVIVSESAHEHLRKVSLLRAQNVLAPIERAFDGHNIIDVISILSWDECQITDTKIIASQLQRIEKDIRSNAFSSYPKIAYLLDRWETFQYK